MKYFVLGSLLLFHQSHASNSKISQLPDHVKVAVPLVRSPEMEFGHPIPILQTPPQAHRHIKQTMTITLDEREGNSPIAPTIIPLKVPLMSSKMKIALVSASALVASNVATALITYYSNKCD